MKVIVAGGRDFNNYNAMDRVLTQYQKSGQFTELVSGDARGADELSIWWAEDKHIPVKHFRPDWDYYGHAAGFIRNLEMGDYGDVLIAFWDEKSKGTGHMIKTMKLKKKKYWVFNYAGELIENG